MTMNTLQSLVFPNLDVRATEDMYLRLNDRSWADLAEGAVQFQQGGTLSSDTFFNGLTVDAWKRHCDIAALVLSLEGAGDFLLTLGLHRRDQASVWLAEYRVARRQEPLQAARRAGLPPEQSVERVVAQVHQQRLEKLQAGLPLQLAWGRRLLRRRSPRLPEILPVRG
jgi:hypothetical protein